MAVQGMARGGRLHALFAADQQALLQLILEGRYLLAEGRLGYMEGRRSLGDAPRVNNLDEV